MFEINQKIKHYRSILERKKRENWGKSPDLQRFYNRQIFMLNTLLFTDLTTLEDELC